MRMRCATGGAAAFLVLALALVGCAGGGSGAPAGAPQSAGAADRARPGGTGAGGGSQAAAAKPLVIAYATEPSSLDGQAMNDEASRIIYNNIFEPLVGRRGDGSLYPLLATRYEPAGDTAWRLTIRPGVTFHNGQPFDAAAAAYSINRMIRKEFKTQKGSYIAGITGAKAVDAQTVEVTTKTPDPLLPTRLTAVAMVPPGPADDAAGFARNPIGTGPYRFAGWEPGKQITVELNPAYWGDKPRVPKAVFRVIPDRQTMLSALQAGEVDLVFGLLPEQISLAPKALSVPAPEFSYIQLNVLPGEKGKRELADPRVRVAINLAVDKETLAKSVYLGHARPNQAQRLAEGMIGFNPAVKAFPYDPQRAKQLLADAGHPRFKLTLNVPTGRYLKGEEAVEYIAGQLREVGIDAQVKRWEWNTYRDAARDKVKNPMETKYGWNSNEWFDMDRSRSHYACDGGSSKYCVAEVDRLFAEGARTLDAQRRHAMYQRIAQIFSEDPPEIFLLQQNYIYGLSNRVDWKARADTEFFLSDVALKG